MDWKAIVKTASPLIGAAIGGPFGAAAASVISSALGCENTDEAIAKAVATATPEQLAAIKAAEYDFQVKMQQIHVEELKAALLDVANAREAGSKRQQSKTWWMEPVLALLAVLGFFAVTGWFMYAAQVGIKLDQAVNNILLILIGLLGAKFSDVYGYFFGSSSGSKAKNELLNKG